MKKLFILSFFVSQISFALPLEVLSRVRAVYADLGKYEFASYLERPAQQKAIDQLVAVLDEQLNVARLEKKQVAFLSLQTFDSVLNVYEKWEVPNRSWPLQALRFVLYKTFFRPSYFALAGDKMASVVLAQLRERGHELPFFVEQEFPQANNFVLRLLLLGYTAAELASYETIERATRKKVELVDRNMQTLRLSAGKFKILIAYKNLLYNFLSALVDVKSISTTKEDKAYPFSFDVNRNYALPRLIAVMDELIVPATSLSQCESALVYKRK